MNKASNGALCALCRSSTDLKESHLIPRFIGDWLKSSSATGYIRGIEQPNKRQQDIRKSKLLCLECEQRFSKREKLFADKVFYPFQKEGLREFAYEEWLIYFAVSLAWRIAVHDLGDVRNEAPHLTHSLESTMEVWRTFLLEQREEAGNLQHHLFFFDQPPKHSKGIHNDYFWYTLRNIDAGVFPSGNQLISYCKLPGMAFWCSIEPPQRFGWHGTQIGSRGMIGRKQSINDNLFVSLLKNRVDMLPQATANLSEKQVTQIREAISKNAERVRDSDLLSSMIPEEHWKQTEDK